VVHLWATSYGTAGLVLLIALCCGYPLARNVLRGPAAPFLWLFVGIAAFGFIVSILAWLRLFDRLSVWLVAAAAAATSIGFLVGDVPRWRRQWRGRRRGQVPWATVLIGTALLLVLLLGFSLLSLYPSNSFDSTSYHLPLAMDLIHSHGLRYDQFARYSFFPQANESMFAVALLITRNQTAAAALEFSVLAAVALLLPLWFLGIGRRFEAGLIAACIVLSSPEVIFTGTTPYVDTWTMAFVLVGVVVTLTAVQQRPTSFAALALGGAMIGEAAASKYTGGLFGAIGVAGALLAGNRPTLSLKTPAALAGGFLLIAAPWFAWTLHTTGDPIYPLGTSIFGNRRGLWTSDEIQWQYFVARGQVGPGFISILRRLWGFIRGVAVGGDIPPGSSPLNWSLAGCVVGLAIPSARRDRAYLGSLLPGVACGLVALNVSADPRYFVPAIGILALSCGLAADHVIKLLARLGRKRRYMDWAIPVATVLLLAVILRASVKFGTDTENAVGLPPTTPAAVSGFIGARVACYDAVEYLNAHYGSHYRAWGYICEQARYYAHGLLISDVFSTGSRRRVFDSQGNVLPPVRTLWQRLRPLHVRWVILQTSVVPHPAALESGKLFKLEATIGPEYIYRMRA